MDLIRRAYEAYSRGDVATMLQFVDPDLEWTYLDPSLEDPEPRVCHGSHELETALSQQHWTRETAIVSSSGSDRIPRSSPEPLL